MPGEVFSLVGARSGLNFNAGVKILFDQGTPSPLRTALVEHAVITAFEYGLSTVKNGELIAAAELEFDLLVTTDRNLRYQQQVPRARLSILVLPTTSWPRIQHHLQLVTDAVNAIGTGEYVELKF